MVSVHFVVAGQQQIAIRLRIGRRDARHLGSGHQLFSLELRRWTIGE
jgi:hypothetical protein